MPPAFGATPQPFIQRPQLPGDTRKFGRMMRLGLGPIHQDRALIRFGLGAGYGEIRLILGWAGQEPKVCLWRACLGIQRVLGVPGFVNGVRIVRFHMCIIWQ